MRLLELLWTHDARLREFALDVRLRQGEMIAKQGESATGVFFPIDCVLSVIVRTQDGASTEVAAIGNEGMVGLESVLGGLMHADTVCQVAGKAVLVHMGLMTSAFQENDHVRIAINRYSVALVGQLIQSAACNRLHSVEQRAARWLLATSDRRGDVFFSLTHEFLSAMLGANRTTVSLTLASLQRAGLIERRRSQISIVDRDGLGKVSCECYETIRKYHEDALLIEP